MLRALLEWIDPRGILRAAYGRWRRGSIETDRAPGPRPGATFLLRASECDDLTAAIVQMDRQSWRPLHGIVVCEPGDEGRCATVGGASLLVWRGGDMPTDLASALRPMLDEFVLTGSGDAEPELIARLVEYLKITRQAGAARSSEAAESTNGRWRLQHRPVAAKIVADQVDVTTETPVAEPPGTEPFHLHFVGQSRAAPGLPYRWRHIIASPRCSASSEDAETAARIAMLAPVHLRPPVRHVRRLAARKVILQADDFTEGGLEQVMIDLAEALRADGFAPRLLVRGRRGSAAERAVSRGIPVDSAEPSAQGYADYLDRERPNLVNAHYSTYGAEECARRGIPFVQTMHNMYVWFGPEEAAAYRAADPYTKAYVCVSNNVAQYADLRLGLPASRMLVIPNGCDEAYVAASAHASATDALRREIGLPPDARVVLNVASIQPPKAQHILLGAFAMTAARRPELRLVVLGDADDAAYAQQLRTQAAEAGISERVHWVGRRKDVSAFHQLADVMVQPSFFEGWSLAITEAVLAGLPVVATDVGGAVEQLADTSGIVVPAAAPDPTDVHRDTLHALLTSQHTDLQKRVHGALEAVLARDGARSPLPAHWRDFLRAAAYRRCVAAFHWLCDGGSAASARAWLGRE